MPKAKTTLTLKKSAAPKESKQADAAILANAKTQGESLVHDLNPKSHRAIQMRSYEHVVGFWHVCPVVVLVYPF